jgi:folate-dependent phosphoribosylglycinamide formyltransferase PurN
MKVGLTTYSLHNKDFREQLHSIIKCGITPDFVIVHYAGIYKLARVVNFLKRTVSQYRFNSISYLLSYSKGRIATTTKYKLNEEEKKQVDRCLSSIKIIHSGGINSKGTIKTLQNLGEAIIVCNSGILNAGVLSLPNITFLNVHASQLPKYRGINNVEWALWENSELYGTIHEIAVEIDEGDILLQEKIDTSGVELKSIAEYRTYCFYKSNAMVGSAIKGYLESKLNFVKQNIATGPLHQYYKMHPILKGYLEKKLQPK